MSKKNYDIEVLTAKIKARKRLTDQEEIYYMVNALGLPSKHAESIIKVNKLREKHPNIIFD